MVPTAPLTVAVIGAGVAGREFALACAGAGFNVILEDVMPAKLRHAEQAIAGLDGARVSLVMTVEDAVHDADLVVDFVPDELESKLEIWALLDRMAPPKTVLCTPSDGLSITDLASCTYRPDRCVMLRGELKTGATLRVLAAKETVANALQTVVQVLTGMGMRVSVENDPDLPQLLKNMNAATLA